MSDVGDIYLNDKKYKIDIASYRGRDIIDFAPRATVPGGSVVMSDLGLYQPLVQTDWQHGFGFHWYEDALGYLSTSGNIDTRQDGLVMMMTAATSSDTDNAEKYGYVNWNGAVYAYGVCGLRKYSGGSWSDIYTSATVNFALPAGDYLFYCPDGSRIQKLSTGDASTDAGLDANSTDYKWLIIHNGYIYAGKDGTNRVHYDDSETLASLEGTTSDTNIIYCGAGNKPTLGAIVYAGQLYVSREDGLWHIGEDNIARNVLDYSNEASSNNFRGMAVVNGFLMFPIRNRMVQWNGARVAYFTPSKLTDTFPYVSYYQFDNLVSAGNFLYCTARTNETTYTESLLCYDGVGWHKLMDLVTNGTDSISAMNYDTINDYMWYHLNATADVSYYIQFREDQFPHENFPTTGTHHLITSRLDMGFRRVQKSMTSLWIETANLTTARYIEVYYSLNGGSWVLWDTLTTNGTIELTNPGKEPTREFYWMQLKFVFVTDSATQSPVMEGYTVRFMMRPETAIGYVFNVIAEGQYRSDDRQDERDSIDILEEIRALRNSKSPIKMVDLLGDTMKGYITAITEQPVYRLTVDEDEEENIEYWISVNFVSVED